MKRGYYRSSRSNSYQKRKSHRENRSNSRSRDKQNKKYVPHNSNPARESRQNNYRFGGGLAKVESDIKNHFRFKLPNLNSKQQEDTIAMLKNKLNEHIGPVQHITRSRETMTLNLGFKYDIDALSFLQTGGLTVKTSTHKIHLDPLPTKVFDTIIKQRHEQTMVPQKRQNRSHSKKEPKNNHKKSRSYSSSSSSNKKSYRSESRQKLKYIKLQIYGIPAQISLDKAVGILSHAPGGPYKFQKFGWKKLNNSVCQYLQVRVQSQKADKMLQLSNKIQIDGRPLIVIEENQRPTKQLLNFQFQIQFPKAVHPSKVLKQLQCHTRIVQMVANQQQQQDGKCKSYIISLNDMSIASQLKKLGDLSCGIWVGEPKSAQLVYRPVQLLPTRNQL